MSSSSFKYDIITLIELVEARPPLWDKTHEDYKSKILRDNKWREVFEYLEESYSVLNRGEKQATANSIVTKWNNIRDAFMRSLQSKSGQAFKKPYVYHENLKFLLKIAKKAQTVSSIPEPLEQEKNNDEAESNKHDNTQEPKRRNKRKLDTVEVAILEQLKEAESFTETKNFFASFIPYVQDMSEHERLLLQMDILSSIKKIKQNRVLSQRLHAGTNKSLISTLSMDNKCSDLAYTPEERNCCSPTFTMSTMTTTLPPSPQSVVIENVRPLSDVVMIQNVQTILPSEYTDSTKQSQAKPLKENFEEVVKKL